VLQIVVRRLANKHHIVIINIKRLMLWARLGTASGTKSKVPYHKTIPRLTAIARITIRWWRAYDVTDK